MLEQGLLVELQADALRAVTLNAADHPVLQVRATVRARGDGLGQRCLRAPTALCSR